MKNNTVFYGEGAYGQRAASVGGGSQKSLSRRENARACGHQETLMAGACILEPDPLGTKAACGLLAADSGRRVIEASHLQFPL